MTDKMKEKDWKALGEAVAKFFVMLSEDSDIDEFKKKEDKTEEELVKGIDEIYHNMKNTYEELGMHVFAAINLTVEQYPSRDSYPLVNNESLKKLVAKIGLLQTARKDILNKFHKKKCETCYKHFPHTHSGTYSEPIKEKK